MKLWRLKKLSTNEWLNEPQTLPTNWGPIFGLSNHSERLSDLGWAGLQDTGWFEVDVADPVELTEKEKVDKMIEILLNDTLKYVAADDSIMTKQERAKWFEYRKSLKEMYLQPGYPDEVFWPARPGE